MSIPLFFQQTRYSLHHFIASPQQQNIIYRRLYRKKTIFVGSLTLRCRLFADNTNTQQRYIIMPHRVNDVRNYVITGLTSMCHTWLIDGKNRLCMCSITWRHKHEAFHCTLLPAFQLNICTNN